MKKRIRQTSSKEDNANLRKGRQIRKVLQGALYEIRNATKKKKR